MTKEQALQKIEELKEYVEKLDKKGKTRPEDGEEYCAISADGRIRMGLHFDSPTDEEIWQAGNCFFTKEEAGKELEKRKARQRIKDFCVENGISTEVDWSDRNTKYYIYYDHCNGEFVVSLRVSCQIIGVTHYNSEKDAQKVIDSCEKELKILCDIE